MARSRYYRRIARRPRPGHRRHNPAAKHRSIAPLLWSAGAALVAGGGYFLWKKYKTGSLTGPGQPSTSLPPATGGNQPAPLPAPRPTGGGTSGGTPSSSASPLVSRLRSSLAARKIYAFQAAMWSCGFTESHPDGIYGPMTAAMVVQVNQAAGAGGSSTFTDDVLRRFPGALNNMHGSTYPACNRLVPDSLPRDVIDGVNNAALGVSQQFPLLQIAAP